MTIRLPLTNWPVELLKEQDTAAIDAHVASAHVLLNLPYVPSLLVDDGQDVLYRYKPGCDRGDETVYRPGIGYYSLCAAWDAAIAFARNYDRIAEGDKVVYNHYFKVRDGESQFISGLPMPGDSNTEVRGWVFVECSFNVDNSVKFYDCLFVNCAPWDDDIENPNMINCTVDGPLV